MKKPKIRILHSLARSGGTILSRCLGCMNKVVLLSEIHPKGKEYNIYNPLVQAHTWHNLIKEDDFPPLKEYNFIAALQLIEKRCAAQGKILLIRDWAHFDFLRASVFKRFLFRTFSINNMLNDFFEIKEISLVRHPIDQWLSFENYRYLKGKYSINPFLCGHARFASESSRIAFVRYEDFINQPDSILRKIADRLEFEYDPSYRRKWSNYTFVTGDNLLPSRGRALNEIKFLYRRKVSQSTVKKFIRNRHYWESLKLLGYQE